MEVANSSALSKFCKINNFRRISFNNEPKKEFWPNRTPLKIGCQQPVYCREDMNCLPLQLDIAGWGKGYQCEIVTIETL